MRPYESNCAPWGAQVEIEASRTTVMGERACYEFYRHSTEADMTLGVQAILGITYLAV